MTVYTYTDASRMEGKAQAYMDAAQRMEREGLLAAARVFLELARDSCGEAMAWHSVAGNVEGHAWCEAFMRDASTYAYKLQGRTS